VVSASYGRTCQPIEGIFRWELPTKLVEVDGEKLMQFVFRAVDEAACVCECWSVCA